jgi:hypothetical protein
MRARAATAQNTTFTAKSLRGHLAPRHESLDVAPQPQPIVQHLHKAPLHGRGPLVVRTGQFRLYNPGKQL